MYTEITPDQAQGKTFKTIIFGYDRDAMIAFDDGTFFYLKAYNSYDMLCLELEKFDLRDFSHLLLVEHGICSQEELNQWEKEWREKDRQKELRRKRRQLEELKRELGEV